MNNHPRRAIAAALTAAAIAVALVGCSAASPTSTSQPSAKPAAPTAQNLTFWYSVGSPASDELVKLVGEFNATNKDKITVEATFQGNYDDTIAKLSGAVQSGDTPDLIQGGDTYSAFLHDSGLAVLPTKVAAANGHTFDPSGLVPAAANYYSFDGVLNAIPLMVSQPAVFFDKSKLDAAGINAAKAPSSIDALFTWADQIKAKTGQPGLVFQQNPWWNEQFASSAGITYCTPGNGVKGKVATAFDYTGATIVKDWTHYQSSLASGAIVNVGKDGVAAQTAFTSGKSAMLLASSASLGATLSGAKFDVSAVPMPVSNKNGGPVPGGSAIWVINTTASSAKQAAALEFAQFLGSTASQRSIFQATGYLPSSKAALTAEESSVTQPAQKVVLKQFLSTTSTTATAGCHSGAFGQSRLDVQSAIESIANGANVEDTLKATALKGAATLKAYNARAK